LIGASAPIASLVVGAAWFSNRVLPRQWFGAALSMAGVLWVIAAGEPGRLLRLQFASGDLIMLIATMAWSVYTWLLRMRRPPLPLTVFFTVQVGMGTLMILPFFLWELAFTPPPAATPSNLAALAYVALLPSLVAYFCWDRGVARAGAVLPMYFVNLTPVFAGALSWIFLGEPIGTHHLVGGALILAGIHLANRSAATVN
jgi:drug/metabolite transporter (DMT)-like permease